MRALRHVLLGALACACALPAYEVDEDFGAGGSGGSSAGSSSVAGTGGNSGSGATAGSGGGSNQLEDTCIEYCGTYTVACAGHEANTYASALQCVNVCATADWPFGESPSDSNSLLCRVTHAQFARDQGRDPHCYHAAEVPSRGACE